MDIDKNLLEIIKDVSSRMTQAHDIFSAASRDLSMICNRLNKDHSKLKENRKSYPEYSQVRGHKLDLNELQEEIRHICNISADIYEGLKWYFSELDDKWSMPYEEFRELALNFYISNNDFVYEIRKYGIPKSRINENTDCNDNFVFIDNTITKSFEDARIIIDGTDTTYIDDACCYDTFCVLTERTIGGGSNDFFRRWLFQGGCEIDYSFPDFGYTFRGYEDIRFKPGDIGYRIYTDDKTIELCVIVEAPYSIMDCWKLNNRLLKECHNNGDQYTRKIYREGTEDKQDYKIYTIKHGIEIWSPVNILNIINGLSGHLSCIYNKETEYKQLKAWYDDYISKKSEK